MPHDKKTFDVFVSHSATDSALALEIVAACREAGLEAATNAELLSTSNASDALWEALTESRALLAILSPSGPTPSMGIEIGAAQAWNKPIYALVTDPSSARVPMPLPGIRLYTVGKVQDVIRAIKTSVQQLTDDDRSSLVAIFADMGVSVDQLAADPRKLNVLVRKFEQHTAKSMAGERLLSEVLRLRKQGVLPRRTTHRTGA